MFEFEKAKIQSRFSSLNAKKYILRENFLNFFWFFYNMKI